MKGIKLSGPVFTPKKGNKPESAIILLHGVGADGENLIGLAPFMAKDFPNTVFIAPNGAMQFDMFPSGYQWFSLSDRNPEAMLKGVRDVEPIVNEFIDDVLEKYSLAPNKLALLGFSQGTMTALHVAARRHKPIAGVVGFSGALIGAEHLATEAKSKPPICLIHGNADDVVPFSSMAAAEKNLNESGFKVETHNRPGLPHSIDPEGIEIAANFLGKLF